MLGLSPEKFGISPDKGSHLELVKDKRKGYVK